MGAALIIGTFTDDEVALITIDPTGNIKWADHYAAVGTGSSIAAAFLHQREYLDGMGASHCIYRVLEAKIAAERNPYVGKEINLEIRTRDLNHYVDVEYEKRIRELVNKARQLPEIPELTADDFATGINQLNAIPDADDVS